MRTLADITQRFCCPPPLVGIDGICSVTYLSRLGFASLHSIHAGHRHAGSPAQLSLNYVLLRSLRDLHSIVNIACVRVCLSI